MMKPLGLYLRSGFLALYMHDKQARGAEAGNDTDSQAESEVVVSFVERKAGKGRSSQVRQPTPWVVDHIR